MGRERRQKSIVATESFGQATGTSAYEQVSEPLQSARTPASRRRGRGEPHLVEYFMATLAAKSEVHPAPGVRKGGTHADKIFPGVLAVCSGGLSSGRGFHKDCAGPLTPTGFSRWSALAAALRSTQHRRALSTSLSHL